MEEQQLKAVPQILVFAVALMGTQELIVKQLNNV
jgi:hypothetical protein